MKILILGGVGFIGSYVSRILKKEGHQIEAIDCFHQYGIHNDEEYEKTLKERIKLSNVDKLHYLKIEEINLVEEIFKKFKPDKVIHLATYPYAKMVQTNSLDSVDNMIVSLISILNLCVKYHVHKFIYASSSMVYGNFNNQSPDEMFIPKPNTLYGNLKYQGEMLCRLWQQNKELNYVILRPSAVYGPLNLNRVVEKLLKRARTKKEMIVDGIYSELDFSYVEDVANYFALATTKNVKNEIFNATRGRGRTILSVAKIIQKKLGGTIYFKDKDNFYPNRGRLNSDKIQNMLNYEPKVDIEEGIIKCIEGLNSYGIS